MLKIDLVLSQNERLLKQNHELLLGEFKQIQVIKEAIRRNGEAKQIDIAIEEMAELTRALIKNRRGFENYENVVEEIADVEIMMQQLLLIFNCDIDVVNMRRQKIERLKERLKNEEKSE